VVLRRRDAVFEPRVFSALDGKETVVDVGCGDGGYLLDLRANGHRGILVGVDFSLGMLLGLSPKVALRVAGDAQALRLMGVQRTLCSRSARACAENEQPRSRHQ
jgi:ubiquinone/menaquinone biosynthesis C-methylase UbiE